MKREKDAPGTPRPEMAPWRGVFADNGRKLTFSLRNFTMTPYFGQSRAAVTGDKSDTWIGPGRVRAPDSSAPQPPGVWTGRALLPRTVQSPNASRAGSRRPCFLSA